MKKPNTKAGIETGYLVWYCIYMGRITREEQYRVLRSFSAEEKLDALDRESADLYELNPAYCVKRFIRSFLEKRNNDAERNSQTVD